jgi:hypothetical protein
MVRRIQKPVGVSMGGSGLRRDQAESKRRFEFANYLKNPQWDCLTRAKQTVTLRFRSHLYPRFPRFLARVTEQMSWQWLWVR